MSKSDILSAQQSHIEKTKQQKPAWLEFLQTAAFAIIITQFFVTVVGVNGTSMMPNLRHGERMLIPKYQGWLNKLGLGSYQRGDVVIFRMPVKGVKAAGNPEAGKGLWTYRPYLVKRVIGIPGDHIRISGGEVNINGQQLTSGWTTAYWQKQGCWDTESDLANYATSGWQKITTKAREIVVPENSYFVMGDNRTENGSEDSRMLGSIPIKDIAGKATAVILPVTRKSVMNYDCMSSVTTGAQGERQLAWRSLKPPADFEKLR